MKTYLSVITLLIFTASCSNIHLDKTSFYASPVLMSTSAIGTESSYEFDLHSYKIHLKRSYDDTIGVIIEKGNYVIDKSRIKTTRTCRLICDSNLSEPSFRVPCGRFGTNYLHGYFVCSDTISDKEFTELGFQNRVFIASRRDGKIFLINKENRHEKLVEK